VLAESQAIVKATIVEDDDSVYPNFLYVAGELAGAGKNYIDNVIFGDYGYFFFNDKGNWAYITEKKRAEIQRLGKGDQLTDSFSISDVNGAVSLVVISIKGVNDKAVISGNSTAVVWEDKVGRSKYLRVLGRLEITDADEGESFFTGALHSGRYGRLRINDAGFWRYKVKNSLPVIQALAEGDFLTESFVVKSVDGTSHKLVVTIRGVNDLAQVNGVDVGVVTEDDDKQYEGFLYTSAKLEVIDDDSGEAGFIENFVVGHYGYFFIDEAGEWGYLAINTKTDIQALFSGDALEESFSVSTVDGTSHEVSVKILGVDEAFNKKTINLSWFAPLERGDGGSLSPSEIGGYHVYYGYQSGHYIYDRKVVDGAKQSFSLSGLATGTYYIAMTTYDSDGRESEYSKEIVVSVINSQ